MPLLSNIIEDKGQFSIIKDEYLYMWVRERERKNQKARCWQII